MITLEGPGWKIPDISGLIFDKDGTVIDSHLYWGEIVRRRADAVIDFYGLDSSFRGKICAAMGYDLRSARLLPEGPVALVARGEVIRVLIGGLGTMGVSAHVPELEKIFEGVAAVFSRDMTAYVSVLPGVESLLRGAKAAGMKLALVTSDSASAAEKILAHTGLSGYFDFVAGRETMSEDKSSGRPALLALNAMGLEGKAAVAIGDAPVDAVMASKAGLRGAVLVSSGQIMRDDLKLNSDFVLDSLSDLKVLPAAL